MAAQVKIDWTGRILAVQPRIRLIRQYKERSHNYPGYALYMDGKFGAEKGAFSVGIGKVAQEKFQFRVGDIVSGSASPVLHPEREPVTHYKASKLRLQILQRQPEVGSGPPWHGVPPEISVYRQRGHRRLSADNYTGRCATCIWACNMPVEITIDTFDQGETQYRFETFCYGPLSCSEYEAGPQRKVPGRQGMIYVEDDAVDAEATKHRSPDE